MKTIIQTYRYFLLILFACLFIRIQLIAQSEIKDGLLIQGTVFHGVIFLESELLDDIEEDDVRSIEFSLAKRADGDSYWEQVFNYPEYGLSVNYISLGHDKVLGHFFGLDAHVKINIIDHHRFQLYSQTGIGGVYANKVYDIEENKKNGAISSHYNFSFNQRMGTSFLLSKREALHLGLSFSHFSNANTSYPNLGVNTLSLYGGINHHFGKPVVRKHYLLPPHQRKLTYEMTIDIGWWNINKPDVPLYFTPSISMGLRHETFRILHLGVGLDLFYDESVKYKYAIAHLPHELSDHFQLGGHVSQALVYNRFRFILQEGYYLVMAEELERDKIYNKVIFKYYLLPKFAIHLSLKTHWQSMKYASVGIDFRL